MDVREKLVGLLKANFYDEYEFEEIADILIAHGVTVQEWISVKDRLPEDWCPVFVMVREVEKPLIGSYRDNVWFHEKWDATFINGAVTHWMTLPQPLKGE